MTPDQREAIDLISTVIAFSVLILGLLALFPKVMIFALAWDDWIELRNVPRSNPERMVVDDEFLASLLRVISVTVTVLIGVVWTATIMLDLPRIALGIAIALGLVVQAVLAVVQGWRALLFRRRMALLLNRSRRPVGPPVTYVDP